MIGALLSIPSFDLSARVHQRLHSRGFREVTDSNSTVMKLLGPEGDRITELANKAGVTKQSMGYLVEQPRPGGTHRTGRLPGRSRGAKASSPSRSPHPDSPPASWP